MTDECMDPSGTVVRDLHNFPSLIGTASEFSCQFMWIANGFRNYVVRKHGEILVPFSVMLTRRVFRANKSVNINTINASVVDKTTIA
jgi:hypothetical protein